MVNCDEERCAHLIAQGRRYWGSASSVRVNAALYSEAEVRAAAASLHRLGIDVPIVRYEFPDRYEFTDWMHWSTDPTQR